MTRRDLLLLAPVTLATAATPTLDRRAIVTRHNPKLRTSDPTAPLSVGNGEFAFTADFTGLQTFADQYERTTPLCTQSQWGWHTSPIPAGLDASQPRLEMFDTYGRAVGYATSSRGQEPLFNWLRENPHRLNLARIGLRLDGAPLALKDIDAIEQELDLWTGILESSFRLRGDKVSVVTCCHPEQDLLAVSITSPLVAQGRLAVAIDFPYGSPDMNASDWKSPGRHRTKIARQGNTVLSLDRELDDDRYTVDIGWTGELHAMLRDPHRVLIQGARTELNFVCRFAPHRSTTDLPSAPAVRKAAAKHWARFWTAGGAIDLSGSTDPRAHELERRVVLSQYLTAIQCAGSSPPQETGLTCNSWYGKFHLEMHWWHAAHFALWNRTPLLERSLDWYARILPSARDRAKQQGYRGARWPKMTALDGRDSPSPIGPLLIWQQPHPIMLAELCSRSHLDRAPLRRYREMVFDSAEFMASYAVDRDGRYMLGPPLIPAQENHPPRETWNPTFELAYWRQALDIAQTWREQTGLSRQPHWDAVRTRLATLPQKDGVYLAHENCPQTYTERNRDHPSMLYAFGMLQGEGVDRDVMRSTLHKVIAEWRWADTWGWDFPAVAMTAARLGEPALAIDALFLDSPKNKWMPNGHNWQRPNLPVYLPGNGALLAAVAMMAAGWRGSPLTEAPGFPKSGWRVRSENLLPLL
ncbi:MAG TPA: glycoside hydrolase family 65 [Bryobacteraceae bacterium]|nr:glycoside hydrolase family 65 [Bryobacteraceae bacterium]